MTSTMPSALGAGEAAAGRLALELKAVVLLDDQLARRAAKRVGLSVVGVSGLLLIAKKRNLIPLVGPRLEQLRVAGYR